METFDEYVGGGEEVPQAAGSRPFDDDGYIGYDPRLPSQRFESFHMTPDDSYSEADHGAYSEAGHDESKELDADYTSSNIHHGSNNGFDPLSGGSPSAPPPFHQNAFDDDSQQSPPFGQSYQSSPVPDFALGGSAAGSVDEFPHSSVGSNGKGFHHHDADGAFGFPPTGSLNGSGSILPPPEEMEPEEGFILREWKRMNAIRLEEKARNEREALSQIIDEADTFKDKFYEKRRTHCETNKKNNRDKEKVFLENQETFHANADKHYWKAVAELIPHELPSKEVKSRGKDKKKPSVIINQGPKPGKATDLTRMRQVLVKLKHNPPAHMKAPAPPPPAAPSGEGPDAKPAPPAEPAPAQKQGSIQANAGA